MWAHVVGSVSEIDLQILVAKDLFIFAKDFISEFRVKGADKFQAGARRRHKADGQGLVRISNPCILLEEVLL